MTTEEFFKTLASKIELTQSEADRIAKKHNWLRDKLRGKLSVEDDFLTGSYARNTMIRPKDNEKFDVDFFLAFNKKDYGESELADLLKTVKVALDEIKSEDSDIEKIDDKQRRSIGVIYKDNFQIDVVPAVQIEKDRLYKIFDKRTQAAVNSNPKLHGKNLTDANDATALGSVKRLVPIVKMLKSWKQAKCDYLKSFHLELLVVETLKSDEITSFSAGLAKFFNNMDLQSSLTDPANPENVIDAYLDEDGTRDDLVSLIATEKEIANEAIRFEKNGDDDGAIAKWKKIFEKSDGDKSGSYNFQPSGPTIIRNPSKPWAQ
ncbi:MAG: nucleotidyltransferase [Dehalococcoidia bacterium]|nr:MAG: nucleotidyltransferase [Dehalococcoidia bacterium]